MTQVTGTTAFRGIDRWKRSGMLAVFFGIFGGGCAEVSVAPADRTPIAPADTTPRQAVPDSLASLRVMLSNAGLPGAGANPNTGGGSSTAVGSESVAWLSGAPNMYPGAISISIRNATTNGAAQVVTLVDGGFDPVGIVASTGDRLSITITTATESAVATRTVPARRPPVIVRSTPPKGRVDVALLVQPTVIFSEPIDRSSVTPGAVMLLQAGLAVAGRLETEASGLTVTFVPDVPLKPGHDYVLAVGEGLRDLDGDSAVANPAVTEFTTVVAGMPFAGVAYSGFAGTHRQVFVTQGDRTSKQLTFDGQNLRPAWSPDGQRIAFIHFAETPGAPGGYPFGHVYIMNADGTNIVARTSSLNLWAAAWSPDGRKLAVSDEGHYEANIYMMNADDEGPPVHIATAARSPAWSPDGRKIAFVRTSGDDGYHTIWLMNPDGTGQEQLTEMDPGFIGLHPSWSPDGKELVFSKCHEGGCGIYRMTANGTSVRSISEGGGTTEVDWSPDGKFIVTSVPGSTLETYRLAYLSTSGGNLVATSTRGFNPAWRPVSAVGGASARPPR